MTIFILKLIALFTMLIDHFAFIDTDFTIKYYTYLRLIGRISFPLYMFVITESLKYTKNRKLFIKNLFFLALLSQLPFYVFFRVNLLELNVIFTLCFASIIVYNIDNYKSSFKNKDMMLLILSMLLPLIFYSDYGYIGVYSIVILYYIKSLSNNNIPSSIFLLAFAIYYYLNQGIYYIAFASIPALLVLFYNKKEGKKMKQFFHFSYPLHLLIYSIVYFLLNKS